METLLQFIQEHAAHAHWFIFGLLMLAGLNLPVSEDLLIIVSGVLASSFVPENMWKLFLAIFFGAYLSDWMVYWVGRVWGERWFARFFKPGRIEQIKRYYNDYGVLTLIVGRFIPFGVRNCLFATAGMGQMSFRKFMLADGIACLLSNATLFALSFYFGRNCSYFLRYINATIFAIFVIALIAFIWYKRAKTISSTDA